MRMPTSMQDQNESKARNARMATASPPDHVTVIFDGTCGFCTRSIRYLHRLDRHNRVTSIACQVAQQDAQYGLAGVDCGESAWALTADGRREAGGQAAMLIASTLLQRRWPVAVGRLPGIRHALALGYRATANNRYRLPGDTPYLSANPGKCGVD
jgi:predicted DCC family thiol-disulfide oxidoreductase YuxK